MKKKKAKAKKKPPKKKKSETLGRIMSEEVLGPQPPWKT